jgi:hypothetical protein
VCHEEFGIKTEGFELIEGFAINCSENVRIEHPGVVRFWTDLYATLKSIKRSYEIRFFKCRNALRHKIFSPLRSVPDIIVSGRRFGPRPLRSREKIQEFFYGKR